MKSKLSAYDEEISAFLSYLSAQRRCSPKTCASYEALLKRTASILTEQFPNLHSFAEVSVQPLRLVQRHLHYAKNGAERKSTSIAHDMYALSSFFKFLLKEKLIKENPIAELKIPKVKKPLPKVLTLNEVFELLSAQNHTPKELRDAAMTALMFASGLRVSEVVSLNLGDIDFDDELIRVMGKGQKERVVPCSAFALKLIKKYLEVREAFKPECSTLFLNKYGRALTTRAAEYALDALADRAGMLTGVSPHQLRHSFATELVSRGADIRSVQELLGHSSLAATEVYTNINLAHLKEVYARAHPKARHEDDT